MNAKPGGQNDKQGRRNDLAKTLAAQMADKGYPPEATELCFAKPWRDFRLDLAWPSRALAAEADGGQYAAETGTRSRHFSGVGIQRDTLKMSMAALLGWHVLRFPTKMIRDGHAATLLAAVLRQWDEGYDWTGDAAVLAVLQVKPRNLARGRPLTVDQWAARLPTLDD